MANDENMNGQSSSRINSVIFPRRRFPTRPSVRPTRPSVRPSVPSQGTITEDQRKDGINKYLRGIVSNPDSFINTTLYNDGTDYPAAIESLPDRDFAYILSKTETEFNRQEIFVRGSGYENIYPGAILFVDNDITTGSPNPVGRLARNKISIYGDFLAGRNTTMNGINPNNADVREATNKIMDILLADSDYEAPGMQNPRTKIHTSKKSLMMDLSVDSKFAGCNVTVNAKFTDSSMSFIQATTMEQDYFTVKLKDNWRDDPASLFADSVTLENLRSVIGNTPIAIVTSVTYGRSFSYLREYSAKDYKYEGDQSVTAWGQEVKSNQSITESSTCSRDEIFNIGGTRLTAAALRGKRTEQELFDAMADEIRFSRRNQGVVMKYTLQFITGAKPGQVFTPLFSGKQCKISYVKCPRRLDTHICVKDVHIGAGKVKVQLDVRCFKVVKGEKVITRVVNGGSPDQDPWYYTFDRSRNRVYGDCGVGEYIEPKPLLRIRARTKGGGYSAKDEKFLYPKYLETGALNIELAGWVSGSVKIKRLEPITR